MYKQLLGLFHIPSILVPVAAAATAASSSSSSLVFLVGADADRRRRAVNYVRRKKRRKKGGIARDKRFCAGAGGKILISIPLPCCMGQGCQTHYNLTIKTVRQFKAQSKPAYGARMSS